MRRLLAAAVPAAILFALAGAALPAAADDASYPISVDVVDDGSGSSGGSSSGGSSSGSGGSGYGGSGSSSGGSSDGTGSSSSGGSSSGSGSHSSGPRPSLFGVDGLRLGYAWSLFPGSGWLDTSVVLHNGGSKDITVTVRGWLTGPLDNRLGATETRTVVVKAGSTTAVRLHLGQVGQWGFVTSHIQAVPPATIDGTPMKTVSREQTLFVVPWLVCALLVVGGGLGYPLFRLIRAAAQSPVAAVPA
jgi:hypothetical protein